MVFAIGVKEMMAQAQLEGSSGYRYLEAYVCTFSVLVDHGDLGDNPEETRSKTGQECRGRMIG